ncbi:MAG TPA: hypothetical protein VND98_02970, partial [Solirubrobacterales bacterium]|nr:hypothetical protein [Solirubrobacterales bacterium]
MKFLITYRPKHPAPADQVADLLKGMGEWMRAEDPKQPRQPWRFTVDGGEPFAFAGICTRKE